MKLDKKFFLTAVSISVVVLILVLVLSPKKNGALPSTIPSLSTDLGGIVPINLSKEKRSQTATYTTSIKNKLPIHLDKFSTSVDIDTSISIARLDSDPTEIVYLNIAGLSYLNKDEIDEKKNPNITAFKESYLKAIELLEGQNIDPKKLIFVYGDKDYVRITSQTWIDALKLHP